MASLLDGVRVIVVEDHADSGDILEQSLSFLGATVIAVTTAEAAAARLEEADVVVTDYALPGHDGVWLLERINASALGIPAILLSGFAASHVQAVADAPFALKLLKPIDPLELGRQIGIVLGRSGGN
jgi:CheY-like chemotaxis protein